MPMINPSKAYLGAMLVQDGECPYFADRRPTRIAISAPGHLDSEDFNETLEIGMRRSGILVYRPLCQACRKCLPLRIEVDTFTPTRSQVRVLKRCDPLFCSEWERPTLTQEKVELYRRYQALKHNEIMTQREAIKVYQQFLVDTCVDTMELRWRTRQGKLVGVGILDIAKTALSSVYFYWDPDFADFSLGTFSVLKEIHLAKSLGLTHYYLGYYVPGSAAMEYKAQFGPAEIWNGERFEALVTKDVSDPAAFAQLSLVEKGCMDADATRFDLTKTFEI